jgi:hypothetical protein
MRTKERAQACASLHCQNLSTALVKHISGRKFSAAHPVAAASWGSFGMSTDRRWPETCVWAAPVAQNARWPPAIIDLLLPGGIADLERALLGRTNRALTADSPVIYRTMSTARLRELMLNPSSRPTCFTSTERPL